MTFSKKGLQTAVDGAIYIIGVLMQVDRSRELPLLVLSSRFVQGSV